MASRCFPSRQVFLAGIPLATEIILSLPGSAAMAINLNVALRSNKMVKFRSE